LLQQHFEFKKKYEAISCLHTPALNPGPGTLAQFRKMGKAKAAPHQILELQPQTRD